MSEFRQDIISDRWVIIAPERAARPTDFPVERRTAVGGFCPFCEGNENRTPPEIAAFRAADTLPNTPGWRVRVVPNRFPALAGHHCLREKTDPLFPSISGFGHHEVIIESPRHILSTGEMPSLAVTDVLRMYRLRLRALQKEPDLAYAMIFKNIGAAAGATLEHTHSQLIATPVVPGIVVAELRGADNFFQKNSQCVFCAILQREQADGDRIILENENFTAFAPYASRFPLETWILPKQHVGDFGAQNPDTLPDLGNILREILARLDIVLDRPAYNYIIHTVPFCRQAEPRYHWHIEIIPRITRVAGFEWGTGFHINPAPPEHAATMLRQATGRTVILEEAVT